MGPTKEELLKSLPIPGTTVILAGLCLMLPTFKDLFVHFVQWRLSLN